MAKSNLPPAVKAKKSWVVGSEPLKSKRFADLYKAYLKMGDDEATVTKLMPFANGLTKSTVSTYLYMFRYGKKLLASVKKPAKAAKK